MLKLEMIPHIIPHETIVVTTNLQKRRTRHRRRKGARKGSTPESSIQHKNQESIIGDTPVINMSAGILTQAEINVLSKGLNFCPSNQFNLYNTLLDIKQVCKKFDATLTFYIFIAFG